jgi:hypothetical protein
MQFDTFKERFKRFVRYGLLSDDLKLKNLITALNSGAGK